MCLKYADMILKQLGSESIDLLQLHVWDDSWVDDPEFRDDGREMKERS